MKARAKPTTLATIAAELDRKSDLMARMADAPTYSASERREAWRAAKMYERAATILKETRLMNADQVRAAREALGMTQQQLADALELTSRHSRDTVRSWESGTNPIPGPARVAIRFMLQAAGVAVPS